jgi:uncharacterized protein YukE
MAEIDSSPEAVEATAYKIIGSMREIKGLCDELGEECVGLGKTFQDEGYEVIKNYVSKTGGIIEDTFPSLQKIAANLREYADLLKKGRATINK